MIIKTCLIGILAITLVSCGEPKFEHLFVKNDTDMPLYISAEFTKGTTQLMTLTLAPGAEDGWRLSAPKGALVESFQRVRAKASKCEVTFSKEQLKTMIQKDGAYRLVLNNNHIDC